LKLAKWREAEAGALEVLSRLAELGAQDEACAAGVAWLEDQLAAMSSSRLARRNAAILALHHECFALGSRRSAARRIAAALRRAADRRQRRALTPLRSMRPRRGVIA
jgi:hypothetical protein